MLHWTWDSRACRPTCEIPWKGYGVRRTSIFDCTNFWQSFNVRLGGYPRVTSTASCDRERARFFDAMKQSNQLSPTCHLLGPETDSLSVFQTDQFGPATGDCSIVAVDKLQFSYSV